MANKNKGGGLQKAISNGNLSLKEALKIAGGDQGKLGQVAFKANQQGATIGGKLVSNLGSGASGAYNNFMSNWSGNSGFNTFMKGMQGLNLGKGQVYGGASMTAGKSGSTVNGGYWSTPATYNPIVVNKNRGMTISGAQQSEGGGAGKGGRNSGKGDAKSKNDRQAGPYDGMDLTPSTPGVDPGPWNPDLNVSGTGDQENGDVDTTTDPSITINGPGNMSGGGSAGAGATGFKTKRSRIRQLGIRAGSKILNRTNKFYNALN